MKLTGGTLDIGDFFTVFFLMILRYYWDIFLLVLIMRSVYLYIPKTLDRDN